MGDVKKYCPKCQYAMSRGYLPELSPGLLPQTRWHPGEPERRRWLGGMKMQPKEMEPIVAFRCGKCGFVELYIDR